MGPHISRGAALAALCLCGVGCALPPDARYVYQDGEYGVIGIPKNSSLGKKNYREQAYQLMLMHFPEGFEIVRAEEVVEGERVFEAARKLEVDSEPGVSALNQMIKVGKFAKTTAIDQKDTLHITESRIIYRRKAGNHPPGHDGFAAVANASPEFYIDPNDVARKMVKEGGPQLAKKDGPRPDDKERKLADAKKDGKDDDVQKASHDNPK